MQRWVLVSGGQDVVGLGENYLILKGKISTAQRGHLDYNWLSYWWCGPGSKLRHAGRMASPIDEGECHGREEFDPKCPT